MELKCKHVFSFLYYYWYALENIFHCLSKTLYLFILVCNIFIGIVIWKYRKIVWSIDEFVKDQFTALYKIDGMYLWLILEIKCLRLFILDSQIYAHVSLNPKGKHQILLPCLNKQKWFLQFEKINYAHKM